MAEPELKTKLSELKSDALFIHPVKAKLNPSFLEGLPY